jgi:tRNA A-37 threonylcarbamoyl transferase component Bud32
METKEKNLQSYFQQIKIFVEHKELLKKYLEFIYYDLTEKENGNGNKLSKLSFCSYLKFPLIVSQNIFRVISKSGEEIISLEDFVFGISNIISNRVDKIKNLIFTISDFEGKSEIWVNDLKLILRYLDSNNCKEIQRESLENNFDYLLEKTNSSSLTRLFKIDFLSIIKNDDNFLYNISKSLIDGLPFDVDNVLLLKKYYAKRETIFLYDSLGGSVLNSHNLYLSNKENVNVSPNTKKSTLIFNKDELYIELDSECDHLEVDEQGYNRTVISNIKTSASPESLDDQNGIDAAGLLQQFVQSSQNEYNKDSNFMVNEPSKGNNCKSSKISSKEKIQEDFEGDVYIKKVRGILRKFRMSIKNKDIFVFNSSKDKILNIIHLSKSYSKLGKIDTGEVYYPNFFLNNKNSIFTFYCKTIKECQKWISQINKAAEYRNINDYYQFDKAIGNGGFGEIILAYNNYNKKKVAIKLIDKKKLKLSELESTLVESEILKFTKHKNIVDLIDIFDSSDVLYIVLEYFENGNLMKFINTNKETLTYKMIKRFIKEIAKGIKYLHNNGILHRDLKPENIMINDKLEIKIVDFGLSKFVGRENKIIEKSGTITYMAPEVYLGKGYNKEADIWSLGMIMFYLVSKIPAFLNADEANAFLKNPNFNNEKFFLKLNVFKVSKKALNLLMQCICEQNNRININRFLQHSWFDTK